MAAMFHVTAERTVCTAHGPAGRLHGHNWRVVATLSAEALRGGYVVDPQTLQAALWTIVEPIDHRVLEDLEPFGAGGIAPTAGGVARWVWDGLTAAFPTVLVSRVDVTDGTGVTTSWTP